MGRVLAIAGSDPSGGAGIQADIKTITALGGYAATAITALTVQDTVTVHSVHDVPIDVVTGQIRAVFEDIGVDAVKTGMLHTAEIVEAVVREIDQHSDDVLLVVDPVMRATGGGVLAEDRAVGALKDQLICLADLVTPNAPEAYALTGIEVGGLEDQKRAAERLLESGAGAVLVKGGHLTGETVFDVLATADALQVMSSPRLETESTHGTGCTLASAIATGLARGETLTDAVMMARDYVHEAIRTAPGLGRGHGPLNHGHTLGPDRSDLN